MALSWSFPSMRISLQPSSSMLWNILFCLSCQMTHHWPSRIFTVMDNASIHNDDRLAHILAQRNITLVKLPPYSFDLNPMEMVFSLAKIYSLHHNDIDDKAVRIVRSFMVSHHWPSRIFTVAVREYSIRRTANTPAGKNQTAFLKATRSAFR